MAEIRKVTERDVHVELRLDQAEFRALARACGGDVYALKAMRLTASRWMRQLEHECRRAASRPSVAKPAAPARISA